MKKLIQLHEGGELGFHILQNQVQLKLVITKASGNSILFVITGFRYSRLPCIRGERKIKGQDNSCFRVERCIERFIDFVRRVRSLIREADNPNSAIKSFDFSPFGLLLMISNLSSNEMAFTFAHYTTNSNRIQ